MSEEVALVERVDARRPAAAERGGSLLPRLIVDAGPAAVGKFRVLRGADRQPADTGGVRAGRGTVPGLVRGAGAGA